MAKKALKKAAGAAEAHAPLKQLSSYVLNLSKMLGGSRGRAYKSCIFGTKAARPKPGHIARCNRKFFGSSVVKAKGKRKGRSIVPGAKGSRIRKGAQTRRGKSGIGPGQIGAAQPRRRTEGR